ncbi:MAG: hypothetical protein H6Q03_478 [Acidobacteria bacterium]|nr:hypothetical protein [Acidobacteriota bacterium]
MSARAVRRALAALALAGAAGHLAFWYLPRERAAEPSAAARVLLAGSAGEFAVWIPFPHLNLARLERRTGELGRWAASVAGREAGAAPPLPRFGPFPVPPADELVVVARADGALRAELAAFPIVVALARAAGTLARNPWLAGGEVTLARGRRGRVDWHGRRWTLDAGLPEAGAARPAGVVPLPTGDTLGLVRLIRPVEPLPEGLYRVLRAPGSGRLEILCGAPPAGSPDLLHLDADAAPAGWWAERAPDGAARALVVWDFDGDVPGLPAVSSLDRGGARPFRLPAEPLARLVGRPLEQVEASGFRIRALEREAVARSVPLAGDLAAALGAGAGVSSPALLAAARPGPLHRRVRGLARTLGALPVVGPESARAVERVVSVLAPLTGCAFATLEIGAGGAYVRWVPCAGDVLPGGRSN